MLAARKESTVVGRMASEWERAVWYEKALEVEDFTCIWQYNLRMYGLVSQLPATMALIFTHLRRGVHRRAY